MLEAIIIMAGAIRFLSKQNKAGIVFPETMEHYPTVTVMVPAHNEEVVVAITTEHI